MKLAEDWASYFIAITPIEDQRNIVTIRKIQADALRYAASLSGVLHRTAVIAHADELDPPFKPGSGTPGWENLPP